MTAPLTLAIRVRPGASRAKVGGCYAGPWGLALVVAVNAPPVDGKATDAALKAVAKALGVRPGDLSLRTGAASRDKLLQIAAPPDDIAARITALMGPATSE